MSAEFEELVRRACRQDEAASAELIRAYEPELRRFIRFRMTDPTLRRLLDSLDICQSVLANFFVALKDGNVQLSDPKQLGKLLRVMAQNKLHDKNRAQMADRRGGERFKNAERVPEEVVADRAADPGDLLADKELVHVVRERLNDDERQLLDRWMNGQDWNEIARDLGGSSEALRKKLSRSIDRVATELGLVGGSA